jgi:hypothetical protein
MIKKLWPNQFQHINSCKLILYKALSENFALAFIEALKKEEEGNKNYGQRLPPLEKICMHFSNDQVKNPIRVKPNEGSVSIIVCSLTIVRIFFLFIPYSNFYVF